MSKTFLFVVWAGGGNVPPQLTLARRVAAMGHEVRVLAPAVLRDRIEAAGLAHEPYVDAPEHDEAVPERSLIRDFEARTPIGAATAVRERLLGGMAGPIARDVRRILDRTHVDVVASDVMLLGGIFATQSAHVPAAMLVHTVYPFPVAGVPPFGMGWMPARGSLGRARDAVGVQMFRRAYEAPVLPRLNEVRRELGLAAVGSFDELLATIDRVLVLTGEAFDFPGARPSNVRYVGPQVDEPELAPAWVPPWPDDDARPLVAVGLSTTYQAQGGLLQRVVDALGDLPVRGFVSTGGLPLQRVPANVQTASFVPHSRLLPLADVVVTHAGLGTVHQALRWGKPLVCLPLGRDQSDNSARLVHRGAAIGLRAKDRPAKIADAIATVLRDGRYAAAARRLSSALDFDAAVHLGPGELVRLAGAEPGLVAAPITSARQPASDRVAIPST
jgi:MGT family glycosyltransferase